MTQYNFYGWYSGGKRIADERVEFATFEEAQKHGAVLAVQHNCTIKFAESESEDWNYVYPIDSEPSEPEGYEVNEHGIYT